MNKLALWVAGGVLVAGVAIGGALLSRGRGNAPSFDVGQAAPVQNLSA